MNDKDNEKALRVDANGKNYGPRYYQKHCGPLPYDRSTPHWAIFFGGIAETLIRSFRPRRVFDAGCALGFLVEAFWDRGVEAFRIGLPGAMVRGIPHTEQAKIIRVQ